MILYYILIALFILSALFLIVLTLVQKSKNDVGAAFGGASSSQSVFGAGGANNLLVKMTYWTAAIFLILALAIAIVNKKMNSESLLKNASERSPISSQTK